MYYKYKMRINYYTKHARQLLSRYLTNIFNENLNYCDKCIEKNVKEKVQYYIYYTLM